MPSDAAMQRFSQQLDVQLRRYKAAEKRQRLGRGLNKLAVAMLIVLVIVGTTVVAVEAVRVRVLNLLMDIQPQYTSFELKDQGHEASVEIDWHKAYVPTYIPAGYEVTGISAGDAIKKIELRSSQGLMITYLELSSGNKPALDTENAAAFEQININGHQGMLLTKNDLVTIIWEMDRRMFIISSQTDRDTAVRMASGVKYRD